MTDTKTLIRPTPDQPPEPSRRLEMSATQLIGGALAAMTAAVIGAQLGVAGTVLGAAIGSVVAGAAGSLYTASLKHTKDKLASAFVGRVGETDVEITTVSTDTEAAGWATATRPTAAAAPPSPDPVATAAEVDRAGRPVSRWPWKPILVSTAAVFLLAIAGITGFELISGQSVSGGGGTTITQVSEGRSGGTDTPVQAPSSDTSTEPTTEPSVAPSTGTGADPSSEPSQSTEPTAEPSQSTEPSASAEPSTTASPSTDDPQVGGADTGTAGG
ncbi:MAG TPA: hypothetical protein VIT65_18680 [Microlunatus sp.]